jgi:ABC-type glycerol-3-phosphate transport system permease component
VRAVGRHGARWALYAVLLFVFVTPLWSILAAALSGAVLQPGRFVIFPDEPTLGNIVNTWGSERIARYFLNSLVLVGIGVAQDTEMFTLQVALLNLRQDDMIPMGIVMSAALLALLPSVIVYLVMQRYFHSGITAGAVKG